MAHCWLVWPSVVWTILCSRGASSDYQAAGLEHAEQRLEGKSRRHTVVVCEVYSQVPAVEFCSVQVALCALSSRDIIVFSKGIALQVVTYS